VRVTLLRERRPVLVSAIVLRPAKTAAACAECHADEHQGQFAPPGRQATDCARCHSPASFAAVFDHDRDSKYPLTGAHRRAPCAGCHPTERLHEGAPPTARYKGIASSCAGCHADEHQGQLTWDVARDRPAGRTARDCSACHGTDSFRKTSFSHADPRFTTFPLKGKHAAVACSACHRRVTVAGTVTTVRYRPLPRLCNECHVDAHNGELSDLPW
jgi:hypothetical protein